MGLFKSKKQRELEKQAKVAAASEAAILEAAKQIMFKKDVEKNLQIKVNALENQLRDAKVEIAKLQHVIQAVKECVK